MSRLRDYAIIVFGVWGGIIFITLLFPTLLFVWINGVPHV